MHRRFSPVRSLVQLAIPIFTIYHLKRKDPRGLHLAWVFAMQLSHKYEVERMELKAKIAELHNRIMELDSMKENKDQFIHAIRKFMEMQTLTAPLLRELIDHIDVYETEGTGKNRTQRIMIHYKFVGVIEIQDSGDNYTADTRKGVAVEYVTQSA